MGPKYGPLPVSLVKTLGHGLGEGKYRGIVVVIQGLHELENWRVPW